MILLRTTEQRHQFLKNFSWEDSTLTEDERERVKDILVEYNDIFARHRFDIGFNDKFTVKLTPAEGANRIQSKSTNSCTHER